MSDASKTFSQAKSRWRKLTAEESKQGSLLAGMLLCFVLSLAVCLLQNLSARSLEMARLFDSGHYLTTCEGILNAGKQILANPQLENIRHLCQELQADVMLDGPVLPSIAALLFGLLNKLPSAIDMRTPIVLEAVFQALAAALVFAAASKLTASRGWGVLAGIIWALYPPAVIGAGKFLTEVPTTVFMLALVLTANKLVEQKPISSARHIWLWSFACGLMSILTIFSKPALQLGVAAVMALAFFLLSGYKQKLIAVGGVIPGVLAILLPWLLFTQMATGHFYLTPQRKPTGNLVIGSDLETDGWASLPTSNFVSLYSEEEPALPVALGIYRAHLPELANLTLRKITRLWANPYNDGRNKFWGIPVLAQQAWHRLIWALALLGALVFAGRNQVSAMRENRFIGYAALLLIAGHLTYLAFVTISRYGFTAMPLAVILAVYGLACAASAQRPVRQVLTLLAVAISGILLFQSNLLPFLAMGSANFSGLLLADLTVKWLLLLLLLAVALVLMERIESPQRPDRKGKAAWATLLVTLTSIMIAFTTQGNELYEWSCRLLPASAAWRSIDLPASISASKDKPDWAMVVFDGDRTSEAACLRLNNQILSDKPAPLYLYNGGNSQAANFQLFASTLKQLPDNFRQWRAVNVPLELLHINAQDNHNTISLAATDTCQPVIYGNYPALNGTRARTLSFSMFSAGRLMDNFEQYESRLTDILPYTNSNSASGITNGHNLLDKQDLSPNPGKQFGQYRLHLVLGYPLNNNSGKTIAEQRISGEIKGPLVIEPATGFSKAERIPESLCTLSHLHVRIKGYIRSKEKTVLSAAAAVRRVSDLGDAFYVPGCPQVFTATNVWSPLQIEGSLPCSALQPGAKALQILITPNKSSIELKDLQFEIGSKQSAEFSKHRIVVL